MRANEQQYGRVSIRTREVASSVHAMTENLLGLTVTARSRIAKAMDSEAANEIIEKATWPTDAVVAMPCPWIRSFAQYECFSFLSRVWASNVIDPSELEF